MDMVVRAPLIRTLRETNCSDCALNPICLPPAIDIEDVARLDSIIERSRPLQRGALLFHEGLPFEALFAVRSGALKTTIALPSGQEQVTGFYLPGELVGLDGIGQENYACTATALENTAVCTIPFDAMEELAARLPGLQHHLFKLMGAEIRADHTLMQMIAQRPAEERMAQFLLFFSARYRRRKLSENRFRLPMSRNDLGNYLGLALETASRTFTQLQHMGFIKVEGKEITILDRAGLCGLAEIGSG